MIASSALSRLAAAKIAGGEHAQRVRVERHREIPVRGPRRPGVLRERLRGAYRTSTGERADRRSCDRAGAARRTRTRTGRAARRGRPRGRGGGWRSPAPPRLRSRRPGWRSRPAEERGEREREGVVRLDDEDALLFHGVGRSREDSRAATEHSAGVVRQSSHRSSPRRPPGEPHGASRPRRGLRPRGRGPNVSRARRTPERDHP